MSSVLTDFAQTNQIPVSGGATTGGTTTGVGTPTLTVDKSFIPYIQAQPVTFRGYNLRPGSAANVWIDAINCTKYSQPASILVANTGINVNVTDFGEGLYCNTTHAYATVIDHSSSNCLFIQENYTTLNITPYGPANSNSFSSTSYSVDELVYQANNTANISSNNWVGRVIYWQSSDSALVVETLTGIVSNSTSSCILYKSGSTQLANVVSPVIGTKFPNNQQVVSTSNVNFKFNTTAYMSVHGVVANVPSNTSTLVLNGTPQSNVINSIVQIVSGRGNGQNAKIIGVSGPIISLNTTITNITSNSYYAIGNVYVNQIGLCPGILWVPEDAGGDAFPAGNRLITLNDAASANDIDASMLATATFAVSGSIAGGTSTTPVVQATPPLSPASNTTSSPSSPTSAQQAASGPINDPIASADPLVQTFFTPKPTTNKIDNGCFLTSCDLFFAEKPLPSSTASQFPVSVYIVQTENSLPTTKVLGTAAVRYEGVAITDGVSSFPSTSNSATATHFVFRDPIYLAPGQEYGLVVYSESPDYFVWVAQLGQTIINSTRLVSPSPYIGSFFKSQNATAWTPIQNQQLMFNLNKAVFSQTPVNLKFNIVPRPNYIFMDGILLHSSDLSFPVGNIQYSIQTVKANSGTVDPNFFQIFNNTPYSFGGDLSTSATSSDRRRIIQAGNTQAVCVRATLSTNDPDVAPFFNSERFAFFSITNAIGIGGISNNNISVTSPGNHINAANIIITISPPTGDLAIQATANVLANGLSGNSLVAINIINPGAGYITSPTITISEASASSNATAVINGEDNASGGNGYTRYITREITLADGFDSGDLKVYMTAVRPQGTDISVYYKVLGSQDNDVIQNKTWVLMSIDSDLFSPDQSTPIDISFGTGKNILGIPNGSVAYKYNNIQYPIGGTFKSFQIKIVLSADDPTVPPIVQNFRAISVPAG